MTTYREIEESEVAIDAPITTSLMTALRDNPVAIAEGDSTAPKILKNTLSLGAPTAGNTVIAHSVTHRAVSEDTSILSMEFLTTGIYRIVVETRNGMEVGQANPSRDHEKCVTTLSLVGTSGGTSVITNMTTRPSETTQILIDRSMTATERLFIQIRPLVNDIDFGPQQDFSATSTFTIGVSNSDTPYGVDCIPRHT